MGKETSSFDDMINILKICKNFIRKHESTIISTSSVEMGGKTVPLLIITTTLNCFKAELEF